MMTLEVARYWLVLALSITILLLMSGGLSMGGPRGVLGWGIFAFALVSPIALWWSRHRRMGTALQYGYLLLAALLAGWAVILAYLSQ